MDSDNPIDIEDAQRYVQTLKRLKEDVLKAGTDYGAASGHEKGKPSLLKPGAEKVARILDLRWTFDAVDHRLECETGFVNYGYRCTLLSATGEVMGQAEGYCNSFEPKYRWKWTEQNKPAQDVLNAMVSDGTGRLRKGYNGYTWQVRTASDEAIGLSNTISKIAQKRAFVAAVLFISGLSEFFTQDLEDMPHLRNNDKEHDSPPPLPKMVTKTVTPPPAEPLRDQITGKDYAIIDIVMKRVRGKSAPDIIRDAAIIVKYGEDKGLGRQALDELKRAINTRILELRKQQKEAALATAKP